MTKELFKKDYIDFLSDYNIDYYDWAEIDGKLLLKYYEIDGEILKVWHTSGDNVRKISEQTFDLVEIKPNTEIKKYLKAFGA